MRGWAQTCWSDKIPCRSFHNFVPKVMSAQQTHKVVTAFGPAAARSMEVELVSFDARVMSKIC
jgi:hypothetical protein